MRDCKHLDEFQHDYKFYTREIPSLEEDFSIVIDVLSALHTQVRDTSHISTKLEGYSGASFTAYQMYKVACKRLSGHGADSGLQIIYVYDKKWKRIIFCEMFHLDYRKHYDEERLKRLVDELNSR